MASLNWHLVVCGINHKSSTLQERESLQIGREDLAEANSCLGILPEIRESAILSTCNRIEFYFVAFKKREPFEIVREFYSNFNNNNIARFRENFYIRKNQHVADHLFRVAAGIDSMVLGENQIFGQLKEAYSAACAVHTSGKVLHRLFHQAFRVGKMVRSDTEMGKGFCSISSAAIGLMKSQCEGLADSNILFIGINQMIALAVSNLIKGEYGKLFFANRTVEKAEAFAAKLGGVACGLDQLERYLREADIIITCTGSKTPIITTKMLRNLIDESPNKKLIIMDMAVPRDVDAEKQFHRNIKIFDLEDIREYVKGQQALRESAIPQAEEIIEHKLSEFSYWFNQVKQEPIYNGLGDAFDSVYREEIGILYENLESDLRDQFEKAGKRMLKRLLTLKVANGNNSQGEYN